MSSIKKKPLITFIKKKLPINLYSEENTFKIVKYKTHINNVALAEWLFFSGDDFFFFSSLFYEASNITHAHVRIIFLTQILTCTLDRSCYT